ETECSVERRAPRRPRCQALFAVGFLLLSRCASLAIAPGTAIVRKILVCTNTSCRKNGAQATLDMFQDLAPDDIEVEATGCHGECGNGPNVHVLPADAEYKNVFKPASAEAILSVDFGHDVPADVVSAYKEKMYGDQDLKRGAFDAALKRYEAALAFEALQGRGKALGSVMLSKSDALSKHGARRRDPTMLMAAVTAARAAVAALPPGELRPRLRLADSLAAAGNVAAAIMELEEAAADLPWDRRAAVE
ncbi:unnamed protein product, partial [Phaeothamnion confervicola]